MFLTSPYIDQAIDGMRRVDPRSRMGIKLPVINALYGAITVDKEIDLLPSIAPFATTMHLRSSAQFRQTEVGVELLPG